MASKFQNRLVGTIVLVALGVILLPGLLDGQKKHYQDEFAAIPLVPKPGDTDEPDMMPAATQALPAQPPEGAAEEVRAANAAASAIDTARVASNASALDPLADPEPVAPTKPKAQDTPKPADKPQPRAPKDKLTNSLRWSAKRRRRKKPSLLNPIHRLRAKPTWCSWVRSKMPTK